MDNITLTDIIAPIKNEYAEDMIDYNGSTYICDAISEIADNRTSIYYSDILDFISKHPDALADVIEEGLYDPSHNYDLYKHGQAAEYMTIEQEIYNQLEEAIKAYAADYIRTSYEVEEIPVEKWEAIAADLERIDNNDEFGDIIEIVDEHMQEEADDE